MIAGNLRHRIKIKRFTTVKNEFGESVESYTDYLTLKCEIKSQAGNLETNNSELFNSKLLKFITYYRPISENDLIVFKNQNYKILSVIEIGYKEGLELTATLIND